MVFNHLLTGMILQVVNDRQSMALYNWGYTFHHEIRGVDISPETFTVRGFGAHFVI